MDPTSELFASVDRGDVPAVARLLESDPSAVHAQFHGATALHHAAARGDLAMLGLLIERGASLEQADDSGSTALGWATDEQCDAAVDLLLAQGARAGAVDLAARGKTAELARALDEAPWMLGQRTTQGTPLHAAVRRGRDGAARLLLARGADPSERDEEGLTALELAQRSGQRNLVDLIEHSQGTGTGTDRGEETASLVAASSYRCGACSEEIVIDVDRTQGEEQRLVEDCPVCCRANVIDVRFERDGAATAHAELE
ncbi:MAG TPA: CPXCG motif-containing cysteine-rich protein [Planctomycetota bacterium]|nr:CPXCG motif-containing cysteine-rich protein [Planctomycetota bacterium]